MTSDQDTIASRYALRERVGSGGSGDVWRAEDLELGRDVAVKRVRIPKGLPDVDRDRARTRVLREARAAARLDHPGVVRVYDVLDEDDTVTIVMAYVDAPTLQELVRHEGPLDDERAAAVGLGILDVVAVAHEHGIVHRDIKPSNVLVAPDGVRVTDFGIAAVTDETELTRTGTALGSPGYLAPEQAGGAAVGPPADLWGLGATLYYAVEGSPPFERGRAVATLHAVVHEDPDPTSRDSRLLPIVGDLLAKDPDARPGAPEVRRRIAQLVAGEGTVAVPATEPIRRTPTQAILAGPQQEPATAPSPIADEPSPTGGSGPSRTGRVVAGLIGLAFVVVLVGLTWLWFGTSTGGDEAPVTTPEVATPTSNGAEAGETPPARAEGDRDTAGETGEEVDEAEREAPAGDGDVPEDWTTYDGDAYRVAHPPSWQPRDASGPRVDLVDPDTGSYLRLDHTDAPKSDPVADWEQQSDAFEQRHEGYEEIRIEPVDYRGFEAAIWEYAYEQDGQRFHAYNLGFTDGTCGYALNLQAPAGHWDDIEPTFEMFMASFRPQGC